MTAIAFIAVATLACTTFVGVLGQRRVGGRPIFSRCCRTVGQRNAGRAGHARHEAGIDSPT
ncbi:MAG: hypothetical protein KDH17_02005 [Rhodocyclaceae bacterium]|nr:hypothetical protein [Rhodocyclaceae bacterium]